MIRRHSRSVFAGTAVLVILLSMVGGVRIASAAHDSGGAITCTVCHDLAAGQAMGGTAAISKSLMTEFTSHGWTIGMNGVGCTFCHRSALATGAMPDVLNGAIGTIPGSSRHPIARNFTTGVIDNTAYLSNDNTVTAGHLDCKDCHDITLTGYPDHSATWLASSNGTPQQNKSTNPYGLKNVTQPKGYDVLCRSCHTSAAAFTAFTGKAISTATSPKLLLATHDNAANDTTNAIRDLDNTFLKPQLQRATNRTCSMCHDTHNSAKDHLFNDGHEKDWNDIAETPINETTDCTTVCHMRGDAANGYDNHGHGKTANWNGVPLNRPCTACHDATKPHTSAPANYEAKYRFPDLPASAKDNSVFGKAVQSVCVQCHSDKATHTIKTTKNGSNQVGCLDCHDQHAKNSDNNVMMIRNTNRVAGTLLGISGATIGSEAVLFTKSPRYPQGDPAVLPANGLFTYFDNATSAGFCDQRACHGAGSRNSVSFIPLDNFVRLSGAHTEGTQPNNSNCESCHSHSDGGGSFRAVSSCTTCHGQPPPPADNTAGEVYSRNEVLSPHMIHADLTTGYKIACDTCHVYGTNPAYHDTVKIAPFIKSFQSVFFHASVNRGTPAYDNATFTCSNITCHSDGRGGPPVDNAIWFTGGGGQATLGCTSCHRGSTATARPMTSGAHTTHLAEGQTCSTCHVLAVGDDNVTILSRTTHVNNIRNVSIKLVFDNDANSTNNYDNVTGTCSGIKCHGNNPVRWVADIGKVTCANCHTSAVAASDLDDFGTGTAASMYGNSITTVLDNNEWNWSGHGRDTGTYDCTANLAANLVGTSTGKNKCKFCHDDTVAHGVTTNPYRLANYNWNSKGWNGNCYRCHQAGAAVGYQPPMDNATLTYALKTSASFVDNNHYNLGTTNNNRHSTTLYNGGQFCWDCHDPHGDRTSGTGNIVMIGKKVSSRTEGVYGIPFAGTTDNVNRRTAVFIKNVTGLDYATGSGLYQGICETCHLVGSGVTHYTNTTIGTAHYNSKCTGCHAHNGFQGAGGSNVEQYFDNNYRTDNTSNYKDVSGHRLRTDNVLDTAGQVNCYSCHGVAGTNRVQNECFKCHFENRSTGTPTHPNSLFEWATAGTPTVQFGAAGPATDAFCLQCHGTGGTAPLGNPAIAPPVIIPVGEAGWTAANASGHGATVRLSAFSNAGPPAYSCRDCHYSTAVLTGGTARDNTFQPGFHASMNHMLVRNDNILTHEYPGPTDNDVRFNTVNIRSGLMDSFCASKCHRLAGGLTKDDNVIDHSWNLLGGQTRSGAQSHPTNFLVTPGVYYKNSTLLPYSNYTSGALPGTGNVVCVTCHNPHGGGVVGTRVGAPPAGVIGATIRDSVGTAVSGGAKNMLFMSPADNVSTLCKQCHR